MHIQLLFYGLLSQNTKLGHKNTLIISHESTPLGEEVEESSASKMSTLKRGFLMIKEKFLVPLLLTLLVSAILTGCGGGGGGGEFTGPALVSVDADPSSIDTGDRTTVTIEIQEVNDDGIMLKIRTPIGLSYVSDSGTLTVDGIQINLDPASNTADTSFNYLVYFLSRKLFGTENRGTVNVVFDGTAAIETGAIDVDPDIDNPTISNTTEFDVAAPKFSAEDSQTIVVAN